MTILVLLVLVVLWIVVLAPGVIGKLREKHATESIDSFHHRLHLLERTGPKIVAPAYRLQTAQSASAPAPGSSGLASVSSSPARANLVLLHSSTDRNVMSDGTEMVDPRDQRRYEMVSGGSTALHPPVVGPVSDQRTREARRRRRDILTGLTATLVSTGLLGIIHSLRALWIVTAVAAFALIGFVALAAYATALASQEHDDRAVRRALHPSDDPRAAAGYPGAWDEDPDEFGEQYAVDAVEYETRWAAAR